MATGNLWTVTLVLRVPMYSVCRQTDFVTKILPANCLAPCLVASKMSYNALDLLARIFFNASSIVSLLIPINFRHFASVVSSFIVSASLVSWGNRFLSCIYVCIVGGGLLGAYFRPRPIFHGCSLFNGEGGKQLRKPTLSRRQNNFKVCSKFFMNSQNKKTGN